MLLIPLTLIPFYSKGYAKISNEEKIFVRAKLVVDSLTQFDKRDWMMIENGVMKMN